MRSTLKPYHTTRPLSLNQMMLSKDDLSINSPTITTGLSKPNYSTELSSPPKNNSSTNIMATTIDLGKNTDTNMLSINGNIF